MREVAKIKQRGNSVSCRYKSRFVLTAYWYLFGGQVYHMIAQRAPLRQAPNGQKNVSFLNAEQVINFLSTVDLYCHTPDSYQDTQLNMT